MQSLIGQNAEIFWASIGAIALSNIGAIVGGLVWMIRRLDRIQVIEKDLNEAFRRIVKIEESQLTTLQKGE